MRRATVIRRGKERDLLPSDKTLAIKLAREVALPSSALADRCGIARTTFKRYLMEDAEFGESIARAKTEWLEERLHQVQSNPKVAHTITWLISKMFSHEYGDKITVDQNSTHLHVTITPEQFTEIQRQRALALGVKADE